MELWIKTPAVLREVYTRCGIVAVRQTAVVDTKKAHNFTCLKNCKWTALRRNCLILEDLCSRNTSSLNNISPSWKERTASGTILNKTWNILNKQYKPITSWPCRASLYRPNSRTWAFRKALDTPHPGDTAWRFRHTFSPDTCKHVFRNCCRRLMRPIKESLWRVKVVDEIHIYYHIWRYLLKVIKWSFQSVGIHVQNDNFLQCTTPHLLSDI